MAQALILDSEALSALAHASQRGASTLRARAILQLAYQLHADVRVPALSSRKYAEGAHAMPPSIGF